MTASAASLTRPAFLAGTASGPAQAIGFTLVWQAITLCWLAFQTAAATQISVMAIAATPLAMAWLYGRFPLAGTVVLMQILLYQNWVLGLFSPGMDEQVFNVLQGLGFFATCAMSAVALTRLIGLPRRSAAFRLVMACLWALAAVGIWGVLGAASGAPITSVATYTRNAASPVLMLLIGMDVGRAWGWRMPAACLLASMALGLVLVALEVADPAAYYAATGAVDYMNFKYLPKQNSIWSFYSVQDVIDFRTSVLFNVTGSDSSITSFRFGGPNLHPISYAYVVADAAVAAFALRQWWCLPVAAVLLTMAGVKGAMLLFVLSIGLWCVLRLAGRTAALGAGILLTAAYVAAGFTVGLASGDFHVIGFLGGLKGFLASPQGHGIGQGGNLSTEGAAVGLTAWEKIQKSGADFAMESAVGVLLYQMGVGIAALLLVFVKTVRTVPSAAWRRGGLAAPFDIVAIAVAVCVVNGIFQEEAYSPYGLGLLLLLAGLAIDGRSGLPQQDHGAGRAAAATA